MELMDSDRRSMARRWGLIDGVDVVKPGLYDTIRYPPRGCIAVYEKSFKLELKFPLQPSVLEILRLLNVTIAELYPNAWGCITTFILVSKGMGMESSMTAFRHIYLPRFCCSKTNGAS